MRAFTLIVFIPLLATAVCAYDFETKYIEVPVDHFSFSTNATFKLKYLINNTFWLDDGPIFFYTGNEGTIETFAQNTGFIFDIAPMFNALVVFAEHRYYGASLPFGNLSFSSPKNIGYLTSNQALADYVLLINELQSSYSNSEYLEKIPVVAFGGSYGGMLSAWLRMKYPSAVVGAIAASAPIWQFQGLTPCELFNRIVTDVYETITPLEDCSKPIGKLWKIVRDITTNDTGKEWLSNAWKLCTPLKTSKGVDDLIDWLTNIIINMAMVNYPYPTSFLVPLPAHPVRTFCNLLYNANETNHQAFLVAFESALELYTNYTKATKCNDIATSAPSLGEDAWDFQACTEMIMPMCSTDQDMFENSPWNFTKFAADCYKKWGVLQANENLPILEYGGKNIKSASNIVFSNGLLDPWSSGGVLNNISSTLTAVVMPEGAHHLDLRAENKDDTQDVIQARKLHVHSIKKWIREYYSQKFIKYHEKFQTIYRNVEYLHKNEV